ncbi:hypothetical protein K474DRAFT_1670046 [Panus rudis PR-1116 ss-1]|nr:hypothetical protein K474DRAFT_1670046 [Panus rudis PR-1116 ss-1]
MNIRSTTYVYCKLPCASVRKLKDMDFDRESFWNGYKTWFAGLGYTLFELQDGWWYAPLTSTKAPLPFATCFKTERSDSVGVSIGNNKHAIAQDAQGRDVVLKLTDRDSMEHKVNMRLLQCQEFARPETFPCVIPPVAILETPYNFVATAMPLWTAPLMRLDLNSVRDIVVCVRCMLTALDFLHRHRIIHRDIHHCNIAISYYAWYLDDGRGVNNFVDEQKRSGTLAYALFDFDLAVQFPEDTSVRDLRIPSDEAFYGWPNYHPRDVYRGQVDYNPFAFDVACLGHLLAATCMDAIPLIPMLAPLFDRMTTHVIHERFTASEALSFFIENIQGTLPADQLDTPLILGPAPICHVDLCWNELSPEFCTRWRAYRTPPIPWYDRVLDWLVSFKLGWWLVRYIRHTFHI